MLEEGKQDLLARILKKHSSLRFSNPRNVFFVNKFYPFTKETARFKVFLSNGSPL